MAQQIVNTGTAELAGDGESIRSAFHKINANFTEIYTSGGAGGVGPQGPQGPTGPSNFTNIASHILPAANLTYDLGSTTTQWRSLYVGTSTIYLGGTALSVSNGNLTIGGSPVSGGNTSTLVNGAATLSISTSNITALPSGLVFTPIENYGFGFGGTIAMQTYGEQLQMLATGTGAVGLFGYGEVIGGPGGVAYLVGNQDGTNEVKIVAGSYTATVNTWKFDQNGSIILPEGYGNIKNLAGDVNLVAVDYAQLQWTTPSGAAEADPNGTMESKNWVYVESGGVYIETNLSTSTTTRTWYFDNDGTLNIPGGGYAREEDDIFSSNSIVIRGRGGQDGVRLQWSNTVTNFGDIPIGESVFEEVILSDTGITLSILVTDGNNPIPRTWTFKNDGSLVFPTLTVPISDNANPSGTGQTLKFNDPSQQAIIYGPPSDASYNSAQRVIIQGAPGYEGTIGEGGDIYLWAGPGGSGGGDGGDIKIRAGRGHDTGSGGYLNFQAGNGGVGVGANGGWINIESGQSALGVGGDITIHANSSGNIDIETVSTGVIRLSTAGGTKVWSFSDTGNLQVPNGTTIIHDGFAIGSEGSYALIDIPNNANSLLNNGLRIANQNGPVSITSFVQPSGTVQNWIFNSNGGLELPGGGALSSNSYDVGLIAGNDGNSTFGSVTINTQGPPAVYTIVQQSSPFGVDAVYTSDILTPNYANIVPGMEVTGSGITALTTVTSVTGPDVYGTITINVSTPGTQLPYLETYTFTTPGGVTDRNWEFNSLGEFYLPQGGAIQETQVTNEVWGTTTTSLTLVPGGAANGTQRLEIYSTGGGEGNHIHITSGDQTQTDLFLGNDTQYFNVGAMGQIEVRARPGLSSPSPGTGAYAGSSVWIYAGDAGDNGGNVADGASGGDILLQAGISTANTVGGSVYLQSANGPAGFGSIKLSTDNGSTYLEFDKDKQLVFPSGGDIQFDSSATSYIYGVTGIEFANATTQTTAFTGTSALLDITNTNGIDTNYYITFVENRSNNQIVRADVDLTFNSWSNTLGVGKISVNSTAISTSTTTGALTVAGGVGIQGNLWAGNIYSNGVQLTAGGGGGVTSITAGTGTAISTSTGAITIWNTGGVGTVLEETFETKNTVTGVTVHDCTTNRLFYLTNVSGNFTPNLTNLNLVSGEATSVSIVVVQTSTARSISGVQIAGTTTGVALSWQGSISAPSGNASRTEVFTFSVLCTGSNAYTVLGMMTSFGGV